MTNDIVSDKAISSCPSDNNDNNKLTWDDCLIEHEHENKSGIKYTTLDGIDHSIAVKILLSIYKIKSLPSGEMYNYQNII